MTPDELKSELTQLTYENGRLSAVIENITKNFEHDAEYGTRTLKVGLPIYANNLGNIRREAKFLRETLQTPPTPGLGAAMLRVVETISRVVLDDAEREKGFERLIAKIERGSFCMFEDMIPVVEAVQALNELEVKH